MDKKKAKKFLKEYAVKKSAYWSRVGQKQRKLVVAKARKESPAYIEKYMEHGVLKNTPFEALPTVDKATFLKKFDLSKLVKGGLSQPLIFTSTSGSTGEPYYFPRSEDLDFQYSIIAEQFLIQGKHRGTKPTLILVCFGMGVWIGGLITYQAFMMASRRGNYPVSILTPGINIPEILKALRTLSPQFSETIIVGYPPFVKDVIDHAIREGIPIDTFGVRLMFAAEVFTEDFRTYLSEKVSMHNIYRDTLNIYGSADIAAMAWETGISIVIKRLLKAHPEAFSHFFGETQKMPTIAQYNPNFIQFESVEGEIILTGDNALPLVRYAIGDRGATFTYKQIEDGLLTFNIDLSKEAQEAGVSDIQHQLPFVCVFERNDFSATIYGLQVYPEIVRDALAQKEIREYTTGKFVLQTTFNENQDQQLEINIECAFGVDPKNVDRARIEEIITSYLTAKSSEFAELSKHVKNRQLVHGILWPHADEKYFKVGIKQKWVVK